MATTIIGREKEIAILRQCLNSDKSEFVGIFGRRRVGKTFLIREVYAKEIVFRVTGIHRGKKKEQINTFNEALQLFLGKELDKVPATWMEAFFALRRGLSALPKARGKKKVIFIDELPWLVTSRSGFLSALEHFWNDYAAWEHDIVLVICGSATSWMVKKIVDNHGGLHNRLTKRIHLQPFTLKETEAFIKKMNLKWNRYQITECYMMMGGIPYYLEYIPEGASSPDIAIDEMFFAQGSPLREEYDNLFASLFADDKPYKKIIEFLAKKKSGYTHAEISAGTGLAENGVLTNYLDSLEVCGFIRQNTLSGNKKRGAVFQLIDPYTLFYLKFVGFKKTVGKNYWKTMVDNPQKTAWCGHAFETVCMLHLNAIQKALGIAAVGCFMSSWRANATGEHAGAEIDLVIERRDHVTNLCEIKFYTDEFTISAAYEKSLRNKITAFAQETKTHNSLQLTVISTYGVKENTHSGIVDSQLTLDDLFN